MFTNVCAMIPLSSSSWDLPTAFICDNDTSPRLSREVPHYNATIIKATIRIPNTYNIHFHQTVVFLPHVASAYYVHIYEIIDQFAVRI